MLQAADLVPLIRASAKRSHDLVVCIQEHDYRTTVPRWETSALQLDGAIRMLLTAKSDVRATFLFQAPIGRVPVMIMIPRASKVTVHAASRQQVHFCQLCNLNPQTVSVHFYRLLKNWHSRTRRQALFLCNSVKAYGHSPSAFKLFAHR